MIFTDLISKKIEKLKLKIIILLNVVAVFFMCFGALMATTLGWKFMFLQAFLTSGVIWAGYFLILKGAKING